jgi:hypothetical protein
MWKFLLVVVVAALAIGGIRMAWQAGWPQMSQPTLTSGVINDADRGNWEVATSKLTAILKKRFPIGSSSAEVKVALRDQGFAPLRQCPDPTVTKVGSSDNSFACAENWDPDHALHYAWGPRSPCRNDVTVWWSDDSRGRLTAIEGQYSCG